MKDEGSDAINLSNNPADADLAPRWSPDGRLLAYTSHAGIIVMNPEGEIVGEFTPESQITATPSWSPDGQYIAFTSTIDGNFEIYTMSYTGDQINRLTNDPLHDDSCPSWSPGGNFLTFASHEEMNPGFTLHIIKADGTGKSDPLRTWAGTTSECPLINWSPDGKYLASVTRQLGIHPREELDQYQIIAECASGYPDWSPDGQKIVFASDDCTGDFDQAEIFVIHADGTNLVRLTTNSSADFRPIWSPDGQKIAFVSERDGNREIYVMNADGSQQTNLTQNTAEDDWPAWQP